MTPDTLKNAALAEAPERAPLFSAVDAILTAPKSKALDWALGYTWALNNLLREQAPDNVVTIQCQYVLTNITRWRHPDAPAVRSVLKEWISAK